MSSFPFPLAFTRPRCSKSYLDSRRLCVDSDTWIRPGTPVDSMAACRVHGIAPKVVGEFGGADDTRDDRPGVHADANAQGLVGLHVVVADGPKHAQRHLGDPLGMIRLRNGQSADGHIGVADRLDLFHAEIGCERVERPKDIVQPFYQSFSRNRCGHRCEPDEIGEEHRDIRKTVRDRALSCLQSIGNRLWKDVVEETLGPFPLDFDLAEILTFSITKALSLQGGANPGSQQHGVKRLREEVVCAHLDASRDAFGLIEGRQHDHRNLAQLLIVLKLLKRLETVHDRHHDVKENDVEIRLARPVESLLSVLGFLEGVSLPLQAAGEEVTVRLVVIDDEEMAGLPRLRDLA